MNVKLMAVALLSLAAGGLVAFTILPKSAGPCGAAVATSAGGDLPATGTALVGGPFTLTDHTGKRVTDRDFRGRHMLVFFGFTNCPDICPSGLSVISAALDTLGQAGASITPILITIDPERDTPAKLAPYVGTFDQRLVGLTGTVEDIAAVTKAYRVFVKKVPDERNPAAYTIDHSSILYLMGPDGTYKAILDLGKPAELADQLRKALGKC